jgi:predicted membrane protein
MEENKPPLVKPAMESGLVLGIILIALNVLIYIFHINIFGIGRMILLFLLIIAIYYFSVYFFTKKYKNNILGGKITFNQAFVFGLLLVLLASFIISFYTYIFNEFIDKEFAKRTIEETKSWMENFLQGKIPEDQIEKEIAKIDANGVPTPIQQAWGEIIRGGIVGSILSLISASVLKTKKNPFNDNIA